jgi:hypothetical protein
VVPRLVTQLVVVALLLGACVTPGADLRQGPGIVGSYVVNGVDPNGTEYSGRVSITAGDTANRFVIEWVVTGAILEGRGVLGGDTLSVEWMTVGSPRGVSRGTAEYAVLDDGRLVGTRTVDGSDIVGTEEIFPEP